MAPSKQSEPPLIPEEKVRYSLFYGVLAGPVIWSLYFIIGYGYVEVACKTPISGLPVWIYSGAAVIVIALTVISALPIVYAAWLSYKVWRRLRNNNPPDAGTSYDPEGRNRFLALLGLQTSALFTLLTVLTGTAPFFLEVC